MDFLDMPPFGRKVFAFYAFLVIALSVSIVLYWANRFGLLQIPEAFTLLVIEMAMLVLGYWLGKRSKNNIDELRASLKEDREELIKGLSDSITVAIVAALREERERRVRENG